MPNVKDHLLHVGTASTAIAVAMGWDKLIVALAAVAGVVALTVTNHLDGAAAIGIISAVLGYVFGAAGVQAGVQAASDAASQAASDPKA